MTKSTQVLQYLVKVHWFQIISFIGIILHLSEPSILLKITLRLCLLGAKPEFLPAPATSGQMAVFRLKNSHTCQWLLLIFDSLQCRKDSRENDDYAKPQGNYCRQLWKRNLLFARSAQFSKLSSKYTLIRYNLNYGSHIPIRELVINPCLWVINLGAQQRPAYATK